MMNLTVNNITKSVDVWAKYLNVSISALQLWKRQGDLEEKVNKLLNKRSLRGYEIEYDGILYSSKQLSEILNCAQCTVLKYLKADNINELIELCEKKKRLKSITGCETITEIMKCYNLNSDKTYSLLDKCKTKEQFDEEIEYFKNGKNDRRLDGYYDFSGILTKDEFMILNMYYRDLNLIKKHVESGLGTDYIILFNTQVLFSDIKDYLYNMFEPVSVEYKFLRGILKPNDVVPDALYNFFGKDKLSNITKEELIQSIKLCLGEHCLSEFNEYVPFGYVSLNDKGVFKKSDLYEYIPLSRSKIDNEITSGNFDYIYDLFNGSCLPKYKVRYHGSVMTLSSLINKVGLSKSFIYKNYNEGRFNDGADWLDNMIVTPANRAISKEKAIYYRFGKDINVYELADNYNTTTSRVINILSDDTLTEKECIKLLSNNISLRTYRNGFIIGDNYMTQREVANMFGISHNTMKHLVCVYKNKDELIDALTNNIDSTLQKSSVSGGLSVVIEGHEFKSQGALDEFIGKKGSTLTHVAVRDGKLDKLIENYHIRERLLFKENSPYSTWFAEGTWIYKCPVCKRKLLMSTEELINYKHNADICIEYEIE